MKKMLALSHARTMREKMIGFLDQSTSPGARLLSIGISPVRMPATAKYKLKSPPTAMKMYRARQTRKLAAILRLGRKSFFNGVCAGLGLIVRDCHVALARPKIPLRGSAREGLHNSCMT